MYILPRSSFGNAFEARLLSYLYFKFWFKSFKNTNVSFDDTGGHVKMLSSFNA